MHRSGKIILSVFGAACADHVLTTIPFWGAAVGREVQQHLFKRGTAAAAM
jgi:hypothetical protein